MIWKTITTLSFALYVFGDRPHAISEQRIKIHPKEGQRDVKQIGSSSSEHHEEYAWSYPSYEYSYKVHDPHTHDMKGQHESRHGDKVNGEYWLIQPDGHKRTVTYHADKHSGFKATVKYSDYHHKKDDHGDSKKEENGDRKDSTDENNEGDEIINPEEGREADEGNGEENGNDGEESRGQDGYRQAWGKAREGQDSIQGQEDDTNDKHQDHNHGKEVSHGKRCGANHGNEGHGWEDDTNDRHRNQMRGSELNVGRDDDNNNSDQGENGGLDTELGNGGEDDTENRPRDENSIGGRDQGRRDGGFEDMAIFSTIDSFGRKHTDRSRDEIRSRGSQSNRGRNGNGDNNNKRPHQMQHGYESYNYPRFYRQTRTKVNSH